MSAVRLTIVTTDRIPVCELCGLALARFYAEGPHGARWYVCDGCKASKALMG